MISIGHYIRYWITVEHTAYIYKRWQFLRLLYVKALGLLDENFKTAVSRHSRCLHNVEHTLIVLGWVMSAENLGLGLKLKSFINKYWFLNISSDKKIQERCETTKYFPM